MKDQVETKKQEAPKVEVCQNCEDQKTQISKLEADNDELVRANSELGLKLTDANAVLEEIKNSQVPHVEQPEKAYKVIRSGGGCIAEAGEE